MTLLVPFCPDIKKCVCTAGFGKMSMVAAQIIVCTGGEHTATLQFTAMVSTFA